MNMKNYILPWAVILLMAQYAPNHPSPATDDAVAVGTGSLWASKVLPNGQVAYDTATNAFILGEQGALTFKPGVASGGGHVATWPEVHAFAIAATTSWVLFVDSSLAPAEVPAGADTDFNNYAVIFPIFGSNLVIKDTGVIRNFTGINTGGIEVEAITTPGIIFSTANGLIRLREGGRISNTAGVSLVPAVSVTAASLVIATLEGASIQINEPSVPVIDYTTVGGFQIVASLVNSAGGTSPIADNSLQADATTTILSIHDGTARLGDQSAFFSGGIVDSPIEFSQFINWQNGDTASRPATGVIGQPYFDTDLGFPIWWNGTVWVSAAGLPI